MAARREAPPIRPEWTDGRRYTRESWKGRRNEKGGKFVAYFSSALEGADVYTKGGRKAGKGAWAVL